MAPVIALLHALGLELQPFRHTLGTVAQQHELWVKRRTQLPGGVRSEGLIFL
jgi:hypothetical protein